MRVPALSLLAVSLVAILLGAPLRPAAAQNPADLMAIYDAEVFQQEVAAMGKPALGDDQQGDAAQDPAVEQALTYAPSPDIERRTRGKLLENLKAGTPDPAVQAQIEQTVASDAVWMQFHQVLSGAGYSTTNLADVTAAYYIITWEVVNGPDAVANAAGLQAVRADVIAAYAAAPGLKDLTDAEKQEAASIMAYMATIAAASANELRSSGDLANLERLQGAVHKAVLGHGIDLAGLRLTDQGFAAR